VFVNTYIHTDRESARERERASEREKRQADRQSARARESDRRERERERLPSEARPSKTASSNVMSRRLPRVLRNSMAVVFLGSSCCVCGIKRWRKSHREARTWWIAG